MATRDIDYSEWCLLVHKPNFVFASRIIKELSIQNILPRKYLDELKTKLEIEFDIEYISDLANLNKLLAAVDWHQKTLKK